MSMNLPFPIIAGITVLPADKPEPTVNEKIVVFSNGKIGKTKRGRIGFTCKEVIGIAIINPRAISSAIKNTCVGIDVICEVK